MLVAYPLALATTGSFVVAETLLDEGSLEVVALSGAALFVDKSVIAKLTGGRPPSKAALMRADSANHSLTARRTSPEGDVRGASKHLLDRSARS